MQFCLQLRSEFTNDDASITRAQTRAPVTAAPTHTYWLAAAADEVGSLPNKNVVGYVVTTAALASAAPSAAASAAAAAAKKLI